MMAVIGGPDTTRAIRGLAHLQAFEIPIIVMTANALSTDVKAALVAEMNALVAKPVNIDILRKTIFLF